MVKKNLVSSAEKHFKSNIYPKVISKIKAFPKFQELEKTAQEKNLQVVFKHFTEETLFKISFEVGFDICDELGINIHVPKTAPTKYYDLYSLGSYSYVAYYNKVTKKFKVYDDVNDPEFYEECEEFIQYINDAY